ncbi:MAG: GNAT family N-acetyltransferase [Gemmatimonadetes bacterium]|nr:GNAT family N-acetyltransferase [Gemmatimonadota bacterium]
MILPARDPARAPITTGVLRAEDRAALAALVAATGQFNDDELAVALQLFDEAFALGGGEGRDPSVYAFVAARDAKGALAGYACWGFTPETRGTCDLYWLAVHPDAQGLGAGTALMGAVHVAMRAHGARLSVVEASGRPDAEPARRFYERQGYVVAACVRDFYAPGDDRVSYVHRLGRPA